MNKFVFNGPKMSLTVPKMSLTVPKMSLTVPFFTVFLICLLLLNIYTTIIVIIYIVI